MTSMPRTSRVPEIEYPSSDGKPMAETPVHLNVMIDVIETLQARYADDPQVLVAGNQLFYHVEGDPRQSTSPDVYVVKGIPKEPPRDTYLLWREGKGPDLVIEITSRSTRRQDRKEKLALYRDVYQVREYYLFDPRAEYLKPPLQGYRLVNGAYVPIPPVEGRLPSEVLDLHLERDGKELRLYDPVTQTRVRTAREVREALAREEAEHQQAEAARKRAETARKRAETARKRAETARAQAELARQEEGRARAQAEAEVERLRRELEALRRQQP